MISTEWQTQLKVNLLSLIVVNRERNSIHFDCKVKIRLAKNFPSVQELVGKHRKIGGALIRQNECATAK